MNIQNILLKYSKADLAVILKISRPTLNERIKRGNWTNEEIKKLIKL